MNIKQLICVFLDLRISFNLFDIYGRGSFATDELIKVARTIRKEISELDCREILKEVDQDGEFDLWFEIRLNFKKNKMYLKETLQHL